MPVEIKEMIVKAIIREKNGDFGDDLSALRDDQKDRGPAITYSEKEEIIEECIQRVMKEIERQLKSL